MTNTIMQQSPSDDGSSVASGEITILGFGSLLSLQSARLTFPALKNFRLGRIPNHRRVFAHPASIFFKRDIANLDTLEMSSLSCEYEEGSSFICSVFEVPNAGLSAASSDGWIPSQAFLEREEEFEIAMVPYEELEALSTSSSPTSPERAPAVPLRAETSVSDDATASSCDEQQQPTKKGVICRRSTDEAYISLWGQAHWESQYVKYGVNTIWNWTRDSGLKPCQVYLRHCVLASWNCDRDGGKDTWSSDGVGGLCYESFLDETYLVDRKTTIREYLKLYPEVMTKEPPEDLRQRYGG